ncbi:MAG TPA: hypothetical protein VGG25_16770 [Streptosporangiaceae bacterium]|jgi:hypothetical protein
MSPNQPQAPGPHASRPWPREHARPAAQFPVREIAVWGAHGGAGTSTLAAWLQPARDLGAMPAGRQAAYPAAATTGRALVVACRSTAWSAARATSAVAAVARAGGFVTVLAVVSDGWPEPEPATSRLRLLEPRVGALVRVPFVPGLRLADDAAVVPLPRRALRALALIHAAAGREFPIR